MDSLGDILYGLLVIGGLIYIVYLRPKFEEKRDNLIFDNRVLAFIQSLKLQDFEFGCSVDDLCQYAKTQLEEAHKLPGNQHLIEHTTKRGWRYCSHTGPNDYALFSILCIAKYAKIYGNDRLLSWCESMMDPACKMGMTRF